ncbi:BREX-1 system adenine-specific DNA-methyltransferase PglX [Isachenkonia alkalipeptolytica]|uniref:site-specific DNA-methyltransferase (adenine-specific) n=1 Tax=Isachenkonia alkalipeptolytica TaxID=2565777 RepID=A0AA43XJ38_9CLOT|nr:BREX-1 system adenine-specific DNA-methyltransferase PglX [Isachenkonia alkalipeptolytica]NBG87677.1 BREX-1 system adenine-specific DNA-methyltransferase PglX [Isachenkonia alkalipeptolytica]
MNKTAIKNFAVRARRQLIEEVSQKAYEVGIEEGKTHEIQDFAGGFRIKGRENGRVFKDFEKSQRKKLIEKLSEKGYEQLIEEVAYTWFNRFIAIRFMEINEYLPSKTRVLSSEEKGKTEPDILTHALQINLDVENEDKHRKKIFELEETGDREDLYKYLLVKQCNQLGKIMPQVFEQIGDYTELLLPDKLLAEGSVVRDLVTSIEEYDWMIEVSGEKDEEDNGEHGIEIIGWLYQYYISEKKDEVFAGLKKNQKITKENIPAATQLFTPKWIVKYMIENSLGRLWLESHPDEELQKSFKYYLEGAEQEPEVQAQLDELKDPNLDPETITVLDPAMGSGHILVYAFDVLYDIYQKQGYNERDIPKTIIERNLYGLDIDDRAGQLASFALLMKGRSRNRRFFRDQVKLNVCAIQESNGIPKEAIEYLVSPKNTELEKLIRKEDVEYLVSVFKDAKECGSILKVKPIDFDAIERRVGELKNETPTDFYELRYRDLLIEKVEPLIKQAKIMSEKYDVVCTNPPYMGKKGMDSKLQTYLNDSFPDTKSDLFASFIEKGFYLSKMNGFNAMVTMQSWMFLSTFENFRNKVLQNYSILTMTHMANMVMGIAFGTAATIFRKNISKVRGIYQYVELKDIKNNEPKKFPIKDHRYNETESVKFKMIPGSPIAYWASDQTRKIFSNGESLGNIAEPRQGLATGENNKFLRFWSEINIKKAGFDCESRTEAKESQLRWFPYNKGGSFRRWYGNNEYLVNWEQDGIEIRNFKDKSGKLRSRPQNMEYYFRESITWSFVSSSYFGVRYCPPGFLFDVGGSSVFPKKKDINYLLGFLSGKLAYEFLRIQNPTLNFQVGNISRLPIIWPERENKRQEIDNIVNENISISKADWDSFETSWDFQIHPIMEQKESNHITLAFSNWSDFAEKQFYVLKENEEELNRIFIEIYGLEDELTPEVEDKVVTVRKADKEKDIKSLISYAIGCSFGRYSLDEEGLQYAGGNFDQHFKEEDENWMINTDEGWKESSIPLVKTNIAPIIDGDYFEEDLLERLVQFVKVSFGEEALDENLEFIADALGKKKTETPREAIRRYLLKDFYKDHVRIYKKRPIYWQFESGKQGAFKALIYMHRYDPYLVARLRTEYLHPLQKKYQAEAYQIDDLMTNEETSKSEIGKLRKQKETLLKKIDELKVYDQAIGHVANQKIDFDLDDGVKVNYEKFQGVEIPQGEGKKPLKENLLTKI